MYSSCFNPANEVRIAFIPYTEIASETCIKMTRKVLGGWEGKGRGLGVTIYYDISIIIRRTPYAYVVPSFSSHLGRNIFALFLDQRQGVPHRLETCRNG